MGASDKQVMGFQAEVKQLLQLMQQELHCTHQQLPQQHTRYRMALTVHQKSAML